MNVQGFFPRMPTSHIVPWNLKRLKRFLFYLTCLSLCDHPTCFDIMISPIKKALYWKMIKNPSFHQYMLRSRIAPWNLDHFGRFLFCFTRLTERNRLVLVDYENSKIEKMWVKNVATLNISWKRWHLHEISMDWDHYGFIWLASSCGMCMHQSPSSGRITTKCHIVNQWFWLFFGQAAWDSTQLSGIRPDSDDFDVDLLALAGPMIPHCSTRCCLSVTKHNIKKHTLSFFSIKNVWHLP